MTSSTAHSGSCLCGAVAFEVSIAEPKFDICHCALCRKWGGGPFMAVSCQGPARFTHEEGLSWYRSSEWGERGFCGRCGTSLFWRLAKDPDAFLSVAIDALDNADDLHLEHHIFYDAKPSRYEFADQRPRLTEAEFLAQLGLTPPPAT